MTKNNEVTVDEMTGDEVTGDEVTEDEMTGDEVTWDEVTGDEMIGDEVAGIEVTGDEVTGDEMTGDEMTGDEVTEDEMTGDEVTWDEVTGDEVIGAEVAGIEVTGDEVTGDEMTGDEMTGDKMTGDELTGDEMTGDELTRDEMTGDEMTRDEVTGDEMTGDEMTGHEMTGDEMTGLGVFNYDARATNIHLKTISIMTRIFLFVELLLLTLNCVSVQTEACMAGWFGSRCQYQCHCKNNLACDVDGQCVTGCDAGWFGTGCQYVNLATLSDNLVTMTPTQTATTWLTDGDDTTCNGEVNIASLQIDFNGSYPFTWLRIKVKNTSQTLLNVNLTFTTSRNDTFNCINKQVSLIDNTTVDYRCDMSDTTTELTLTGPALKFLCSFYISGGRNVALRQSAEQTSTYSERNVSFTAPLAVDGRTNCNLTQGSTSHTFDTDTNPSWSLTLDTPKVINRFVIYNRGDCCRIRLRHFQLTTFDTNNNKLWTYQDPIQQEDTATYTFSRIQNNAVSKIRIIPTYRHPSDTRIIVSLCEVSIYGECAKGFWGLDCTQKCPEECLYSCQQDTGLCLSLLSQSDTPQRGTECDRNHWGLNCQHNCSENCYNKTCDKVTGRCDSGCDIGYSNPPDYSLDCLSRKLGLNSINECSIYYSNKSCDKVTVVCQEHMKCNDLTTNITAHHANGSNTMAFEASIGIGIAIGAGLILFLDVVMLLIYKARFSKTVLKERQEIDPKKETQLHEKNNKERQLQSLETHSGHYDDFKHLNEYQHFYEKTHNKADAGHDESDSSSKYKHVQTSHYDSVNHL
ncbi:Fucolectin-1 [Biomphalaria glabrata]|nr:cell death abnormality protein 1-like; partial [Biomphalaria glabrata]